MRPEEVRHGQQHAHHPHLRQRGGQLCSGRQLPVARVQGDDVPRRAECYGLSDGRSDPAFEARQNICRANARHGLAADHYGSGDEQEMDRESDRRRAGWRGHVGLYSELSAVSSEGDRALHRREGQRSDLDPARLLQIQNGT